MRAHTRQPLKQTTQSTIVMSPAMAIGEGPDRLGCAAIACGYIGADPVPQGCALWA